MKSNLALTRSSTRKLLDMLSENLVSADQVVLACLNYMSEDEVTDMCRVNSFFDYEETEDHQEED